MVDKIKAIHVVHWSQCPHCHPVTVEPLEKASKKLRVPFFSYDIEIPEQEKKADELVRKHGDWSEDYLVPQVFIEMDNGEMRHILTGYSESVDLTRRAVSNLLNSRLFVKAIGTSGCYEDEFVRSATHNLLNVVWPCHGHCEMMSQIEFLGDESSLAAQVCLGRYVSRIISYGKQVDTRRLKEFVRSVTPGMELTEDGDIRIASRYAWDLGLPREKNDFVLREAYWTQNYRRTRSEMSDRLALFLCSNRDSFFVQRLNSNAKQCPNCRI